MDIKVVSGDLTAIKAGAVIITLFEGEEQLGAEATVIDRVLDGAISSLISSGEIKGKLNQITVIHSFGKLPADRVAVAGLGKDAELNIDKIRGLVAGACRRLRGQEVTDIAISVPGAGINGITPETSAQAIAEGALLGTYTFRKHITKEEEHAPIEVLNIVNAGGNNTAALEQGVEKGVILAEATNQARDMVNEPSNYMTPVDLAGVAAGLAADTGLEATMLEREDMEKLGMGALLGVAQAAVRPPRFIILNYKGTKSKDIDIALLGKAITFDSGGISIKPSEGMGEMKSDMAGGAAVIAAMGAIARLKPAINVLGLVPATENLPGGNAFKPGDILTAMGGKTIEIMSTDAEGRLALSDAIGYAREQNARLIVDVATLTGACRIALGDVCTGTFGNDQDLIDKVVAAGAEVGERMWQMPMFDEYKEQNKSDVADIKNTGGRLAGAITAAQFLAEFAGDSPWVHLDIAGTSMSEKVKDHQVKGATGVPVRTLVNLVLNLAGK